MARPHITKLGPLAAASANGICLSQTPLGAGNLTLNGAAVSGGVATLSPARRVLLTTTADETGKTFTFYGTDRESNSISEAFAGPNNGTAYTQQDFLTITRVSASAATAGAVTVGTNGVASSAWQILNYHGLSEISLQVDVSGTVNYTVQNTDTNLWNLGVGGNASLPDVFDHPHLSGMTIAATDSYRFKPFAVRITSNSGFTGTDYATLTATQAGLAGS